jgi:hypothetical protein
MVGMITRWTDLRIDRELDYVSLVWAVGRERKIDFECLAAFGDAPAVTQGACRPKDGFPQLKRVGVVDTMRLPFVRHT